MEIIGAGLGRTGTHSLAAALEILGFGPCYHMQAFSAHPEHHVIWEAALQGETVAWQELFAGFKSSVEWPAVSFLAEMLAAFPEAKVVYTQREPQSWYASAAATIFRGLEKSRYNPDPARRQQAHLARAIVLERFFGNRHWDQQAACERYRQHAEELQALASPGRLLRFEVTQGWAPLCEFLEVEAPAVEFPWLHARQEFLAGEPEWARKIDTDHGENQSQ